MATQEVGVSKSDASKGEAWLRVALSHLHSGSQKEAIGYAKVAVAVMQHPDDILPSGYLAYLLAGGERGFEVWRNSYRELAKLYSLTPARWGDWECLRITELEEDLMIPGFDGFDRTDCDTEGEVMASRRYLLQHYDSQFRFAFD